MSQTVTSYMPTGNATVTRNAETWNYTLTAAPQALSAYLKFKEMGTNVGAGVIRFLRFGGASGTANLYITYNNGYGIRFVTAAGTTSSAVLSTLPVVGNIVELLMTLANNGTVVITQTINGGAAVVGGNGTAKALPQAWAAQTFEVTAPGTNLGDTGILACVVVRGVQSLDTMRRYAGTHTRNG